MNGQSRLTPGPVSRIMALVRPNTSTAKILLSEDRLSGLRSETGEFLVGETT